MRKVMIVLASAMALVSSAQASPPSVPPADAPALAALGSHAVGTDQLTIGKDGRSLRVVLWYPTRGAGNAPAVTYEKTLQPSPPHAPFVARAEGIARAKAAPASGRFPLIVLSHGFQGWPESISYLGENLASKGYVVAAIDHADLPIRDAASFQRALGVTAATRARDQQAVIASLASDGLPSSLRGSVDPNRIGLIGYSMGGFGALATAGAGYDPASASVKGLPAGALAGQLEGERKAIRGLRALVLIAPWGGQQPYRSWSPMALQALRVPTLFIAGEEDDISDYRGGIRWLYDGAVNADRHLLLYRLARHNVGGNPSPEAARSSFQLREMFDEPVWRQDRINAINLHFLTAFLDLKLKDDGTKAAFLKAPAAGAEWPGFQKRWSLGFAVETAPAR